MGDGFNSMSAFICPVRGCLADSAHSPHTKTEVVSPGFGRPAEVQEMQGEISDSRRSRTQPNTSAEPKTVTIPDDLDSALSKGTRILHTVQ